MTGWRGAEGLSRTHASGRWLGTKQAGVCAVGYMSSPKGETFREECEPTLPQGSPKGDMSGSERVKCVAQGGQPERSAVTRQRTKTRRGFQETAPTERRPPKFA